MIELYKRQPNASDRTHDGRHRQRGTQISPLKLVAILMDAIVCQKLSETNFKNKNKIVSRI